VTLGEYTSIAIAFAGVDANQMSEGKSPFATLKLLDQLISRIVGTDTHVSTPSLPDIPGPAGAASHFQNPNRGSLGIWRAEQRKKSLM